jgi:hypothetical protein
MARTNVERNSSPAKRSQKGSGRNNGAPVEFELARFCAPRPSEARELRTAPRVPARGVFVHW